MAEDASAYAALGLEPDADDAEIERAYKRLIKEHHPDREGGDATRAAEINRAYRELRSVRHLKPPLDFHDDYDERFASGRRGWPAFVLTAFAAIVALLFLTGPFGLSADAIRSPVLQQFAAKHDKSAAADPMDQPLHIAAITAAARRAQLLSRTRDEMALANASRDCHHALRNDPSLLQLDRCAAFDDAVVQLQDRDPLRDQGPFSELAVTGRLWSGATALSDDYVAIDSRLDRIRLQAELALLPAASPAPAHQN
ncbi:MAG: J domain-containing protein [Sphingomonas sp.]|nr:J domain-containing protein [Sphingomonas sp.]